MGKNRNKKLRNITVDGKDYKWLAESSGEDTHVKIWVDKNTTIYDGIFYQESVPPSDIAEVINEINWQEHG